MHDSIAHFSYTDYNFHIERIHAEIVDISIYSMMTAIATAIKNAFNHFTPLPCKRFVFIVEQFEVYIVNNLLRIICLIGYILILSISMGYFSITKKGGEGTLAPPPSYNMVLQRIGVDLYTI